MRSSSHVRLPNVFLSSMCLRIAFPSTACVFPTLQMCFFPLSVLHVCFFHHYAFFLPSSILLTLPLYIFTPPHPSPYPSTLHHSSSIFSFPLPLLTHAHTHLALPSCASLSLRFSITLTCVTRMCSSHLYVPYSYVFPSRPAARRPVPPKLITAAHVHYKSLAFRAIAGTRYFRCTEVPLRRVGDSFCCYCASFPIHSRHIKAHYLVALHTLARVLNC